MPSRPVGEIRFDQVYPLLVKKAERKGRTQSEVDEIICWMTGYSEEELRTWCSAETTYADFFAHAQINPACQKIKGTICGIRVEDIEDPLTQQVRWLDKLVDELAKGKPMEKIKR